MMENTKDEYVAILCELLNTPLYQGLASIYDVAIKHRDEHEKGSDELKIFKELLKSIVPRWNDAMLEREVTRIREVTKQGTMLDQVFRAALKSNIILMTRSTDFSLMSYVRNEHWAAARFETFIHKCYIFSAREVFNAPYLFRKTDDLELSHARQKEAMTIIRACVENALRHSLPLKEILQEFMEEPSDKKKVFSNSVSLLDEEGKNQMEKIFSTYNIRESMPRLFSGNNEKINTPHAQEEPKNIPEHTMQYGGREDMGLSHHTITNFLMHDQNIIRSESLPQSPIMED